MPAKMTREERGWSYLQQAINEKKVRRVGGSRYPRSRARQRDYDRLLAVAISLGLTVRPMSEAERLKTYKDASGREFHAGGLFIAPSTIALAWPSYRTLLHELAHAVDFQLGRWHLSPSDTEAIAISVEYLVSVCQLGAAYVHPNLSYALQWQVTPAVLERNAETIQVIRDLILEALDVQAADKVSA